MAKDFFQITVKEDKKFFEQLCLLPEKGAARAMSRSINDALRKGETEFEKEAPKIYNMKKSEIKLYSKVKTCYPGNLKKGHIQVRSRRFTVGQTHFKASPNEYIIPGTLNKNGKVIKRKKQKVKIRKDFGWKEVPHGFIANPASIKGGNTMVWIRLGKKRKPIFPIRTISAAQMLSNKKIYNHVEEEMEKHYLKRMEHHLDREFENLK